MATGWLMRSDIVVTAGSNVFDWTNLARPLGKAMQIKCYIGYHGGSSVGAPSVQFRLAKAVVTTPEWLAGPDNRHRDIAFLQLDRPFEGNLRLFGRKETTPVQGHFMLGVVGYPGDKGRDAGLYDEYGGEMYEMFTTQKYNLHDPPSNNAAGLLEYDISTRGGQAGSPVLRKDVDSMTVIGTHVHRTGEKGRASVIGHHGNDYNMMLEAFDVDLPVISDSNGIRLVQHPISTPIQSPGDFDIISPGAFGLASPASTVLETPIDCDSWVAVSRKGFPVGGAVPPHLIKTSVGQGLSLGHGIVGPLTPPDENIIRLPVGNLLEVFGSPVSPGDGF
ncbi:hypothetical protein B0T14DRAFT_314903 [Immersiella caudata]|uniref:Serine protease n=1 Tax=Immersiella caudata TaxID=314043 RepID=A0AA39W9Z5_9PEZI|nr:hypothetical protein B0T14DRAFT_314903 [Immersiella caudata]